MTAGGAGMTVNVTTRPTVMESASIDSGLRRNDGWGRRNDGEYGRTPWGRRGPAAFRESGRPRVGGGRRHFENQDGLGAAGAGGISRIGGMVEEGGLDWRNWLKGGGEFLSLGRRLGYNWDTTDCAFMVRKHNIRRFQK